MSFPNGFSGIANNLTKSVKNVVTNVDDFITNSLRTEYENDKICKMAARGHAIALGADIVDGSSDKVSTLMDEATDLSLWQCTGKSPESYIITKVGIFVIVFVRVFMCMC